MTDYKEAYDKADIVVFLTAHIPFRELEWRGDKVTLDFVECLRNKMEN